MICIKSYAAMLTATQTCSLEWSSPSSHREWCFLTENMEAGRTTQKTSTVSSLLAALAFSASLPFLCSSISKLTDCFGNIDTDSSALIFKVLNKPPCCSVWAHHQDRPDCCRHRLPLDMGRHTATEFQPGLQERSLWSLLVSLSLLSLFPVNVYRTQTSEICTTRLESSLACLFQ